MKRYAPEDRDDIGPLFSSPTAIARVRAHEAAQAATDKAEREEPGWKSAALEAVRLHALTHAEPFMIQDVAFSVPDGADNRARTYMASAAKLRGWTRHAGFGTDRWGSIKSLWASLIYAGERA